MSPHNDDLLTLTQERFEVHTHYGGNSNREKSNYAYTICERVQGCQRNKTTDCSFYTSFFLQQRLYFSSSRDYEAVETTGWYCTIWKYELCKQCYSARIHGLLRTYVPPKNTYYKCVFIPSICYSAHPTTALAPACSFCERHRWQDECVCYLLPSVLKTRLHYC